MFSALSHFLALYEKRIILNIFYSLVYDVGLRLDFISMLVKFNVNPRTWLGIKLKYVNFRRLKKLIEKIDYVEDTCLHCTSKCYSKALLHLFNILLAQY